MPRRFVAFLASVALVGGCASDGGARLAEVLDEQESLADTASQDDRHTTELPAVERGHPSPLLPTVCPFEVEVDLDVTCGVVEIPTADRTTVALAVAILHTPADDPAPDPVMYLAGGPGGVSLAEHFIWLSGADDWREHPILSRRDLVLVDQRGVGYSRPSLWCDETGGEEPEACHARLVEADLDLSAFSTVQSAADVVEVGLALGLDEWNLLGSSYGTRLALAVLRDHPDVIRSVVLEGVYPPDVVPAYHEFVDHALRSLDELAAACADDAPCEERFGDVMELLASALDTADAAPGGDGAFDLMDLVFGALYHVDGLLDVPLALELAASGDLDAATDVLLEGSTGFTPRRPVRPQEHDALSSGDPAEDSSGLFYSIECREEIPFTDLAVIDRRLDELEAGGVDGLLLATLIDPIVYQIEEICPRWESGIAAPEERRPAVSDTPVLLLSGRFDPVTPPVWGDRAAATLSRSTHVVAPSLSHSLVLEDPCIDGIVAMFLDDPSSTPETSCVDTMRLPPFSLD